MASSVPNPAPAQPGYGVLFLPALIRGAAQQQDIMLPLTLTYLLSAHLSFYLPVEARSVPMVESIFDQVMNTQLLKSKGIVYTSPAKPEDLDALLEGASLVILSQDARLSGPNLARMPQAVVCFTDGKISAVRLLNTERLRDSELRSRLVGCVQLINVQAGGFVTEGHFSLSW